MERKKKYVYQSISKVSPQPQTAFTFGFKNFTSSLTPSDTKSTFVPFR